ncbi:DUF4389 domain-containing protein, partial [Oceanospirillum sp. HFRX-1_2]
AFWLRIIFMLFFVVAYQIAELLIGLSILVQVIFIAITGEKNLFLQQAGACFSSYAYQVYRYLTYNREEKPFPFTPWPEGDAADRDPYQSPDED